jgi:hypothetical protein
MSNSNKTISSSSTQPQPDSTHNPWEFENPWSHQLCNCSERCDETCYGLWCFPCFTCQLAWRMNESCWITCCLPGYLAILRTKMRTAFRIRVCVNIVDNDECKRILLFVFISTRLCLFSGLIFIGLLCSRILSLLYSLSDG